eukprot:TRINITY_DN0_c756_g1_i1.p2 TRINITY_DN0_c756_g1~~TRINITY_DN0_c756_g1_i1.p2  ORF type:complete len:128 (+),score=35.91 TRINITY_DN0_c756_g1_i1:138-521(+)
MGQPIYQTGQPCSSCTCSNSYKGLCATSGSTAGATAGSEDNQGGEETGDGGENQGGENEYGNDGGDQGGEEWENDGGNQGGDEWENDGGNQGDDWERSEQMYFSQMVDKFKKKLLSRARRVRPTRKQ